MVVATLRKATGKPILLFFGLLVCFLFLSSNSKAQSVDSTLKKKHSPKLASIYSAVLPGLGQAYNKKYWKIPIVYTGVAAVTYFAIANNNQYSKYKTAYKYRMDGDSTTVDNYVGLYNSQNLLDLRNYYRRNLELTVIAGVVVYALNIIDASVDAHLFDFDIDDNLSLKYSPLLLVQNNKITPGISLSISLKSFK